ncbi:MAG: hypothetical protein ACOZNI_35335 [Myxococcota bacterium]
MFIVQSLLVLLLVGVSGTFALQIVDYLSLPAVLRRFHRGSSLYVQVAAQAVAFHQLSVRNERTILTLYGFPRRISAEGGPRSVPEVDVVRAMMDPRTREYIDKQLEHLRQASSDYPKDFESLNAIHISTAIAATSKKFPSFNRRVLTWSSARDLASAFGLKVDLVPRFPLLSALVKDSESHSIVVREDLPDALRVFLVAHEVGHFVLHLTPMLEGRTQHALYNPLHGEYDIAEYQADVFGLLAVMPTPVVAHLLDSAESPSLPGVVSTTVSAEPRVALLLEKIFFEDYGVDRTRHRLVRQLSQYVHKRLRILQDHAVKRLQKVPLQVDEIGLETFQSLKGSIDQNAVWGLLGRDLRLIESSSAFHKLTAGKATVLGDVRDTIHADYHSIIDHSVGRVWEGKVSIYVLEYLNGDGTTVPAYVRAIPVRDQQGQICGSLGFVVPV